MLASIATALFAQTTVGTGSIVGVVADPIIGDNSSELCPVIATSSCRRRIRRRCSATDPVDTHGVPGPHIQLLALNFVP